MNRIAILLFCAAPVTACAVDADVDTGTTAQELDPSGAGGGGEPPDAKVHLARDHAGAGGAAGTSPNLVAHGGPVMAQGAYVEPIFWGTSWGSPGDKISGIQSFYGGMGGSPYDATNSEYTAGGAHVGTGVTLGATHVDLSAAARSGSRTSPILTEVCAQIASPRADGYYPVYTDTPRGNAGYCAWHSAGTCNGVTVQFAFFFKLDGDAGCDPQDTSGLHSQGLAAIANVSGHELSEALTDPHLDAWYDSSGSENSDKCAWAFGTPLVTFSNNSKWKIQGNWSNAAYTAGTGYANSSGQKGCLDGGNYR